MSKSKWQRSLKKDSFLFNQLLEYPIESDSKNLMRHNPLTTSFLTNVNMND